MDETWWDIGFRVIDGGFVNGHDRTQWSDSRPHADPFSRLYYISGGRGLLEYNGDSYRLMPGMFYIFPAHYPIFHMPSPGLVQYYVHFTAQLMGALSLFNVTTWDCERPAGNAEAACERMRRIIAKPEGLSEALRIQSLLQETVASFLRGMVSDLPRNARQMRRFGAVVEYINQHLEGKMSLSSLASIASLHPNYFSNTFSETFGMPPREYIVQKRMEKAQLLLWETDRSIKEIAAATGCEGAPYFSRIFRKRVGMSPSQYRRQRQADPLQQAAT